MCKVQANWLCITKPAKSSRHPAINHEIAPQVFPEQQHGSWKLSVYRDASIVIATVAATASGRPAAKRPRRVPTD